VSQADGGQSPNIVPDEQQHRCADALQARGETPARNTTRPESRAQGENLDRI